MLVFVFTATIPLSSLILRDLGFRTFFEVKSLQNVTHPFLNDYLSLTILAVQVLASLLVQIPTLVFPSPWDCWKLLLLPLLLPSPSYKMENALRGEICGEHLIYPILFPVPHISSYFISMSFIASVPVEESLNSNKVKATKLVEREKYSALLSKLCWIKVLLFPLESGQWPTVVHFHSWSK